MRSLKSQFSAVTSASTIFNTEFASMKIPSLSPKFRSVVRVGVVSLTVASTLVAIDLSRPLINYYELRNSILTKGQVDRVKADFAHADKCGTVPGDDDKTSAFWRSCTLGNFAAPNTVAGAFYTAWRASTWLRRHPDDHAMRAYARKVIDAGWNAYRNDQARYALHDQFTEAMNRSMTVALFQGKYPSVRESEARILEEVELAIEAPTLFETRGRRRTAAALVRNAAEADVTPPARGVERNENGAG